VGDNAKSTNREYVLYNGFARPNITCKLARRHPGIPLALPWGLSSGITASAYSLDSNVKDTHAHIGSPSPLLIDGPTHARPGVMMRKQNLRRPTGARRRARVATNWRPLIWPPRRQVEAAGRMGAPSMGTKKVRLVGHKRAGPSLARAGGGGRLTSSRLPLLGWRARFWSSDKRASGSHRLFCLVLGKFSNLARLDVTRSRAHLPSHPLSGWDSHPIFAHPHGQRGGQWRA